MNSDINLKFDGIIQSDKADYYLKQPYFVIILHVLFNFAMISMLDLDQVLTLFNKFRSGLEIWRVGVCLENKQNFNWN